MTADLLPRFATDELVTVAWIGSIPGLSPQMVATQLPPDTEKDGSPAAWVKTGFVTVSVVGGNPDDMLPVDRPVMQIDTWATIPGSNKPPWERANRLAKAIQKATIDRVSIPRPLTIVSKGVVYPSAAVQGARALSTPRRVYDDAGDYARYTFDLWLSWITLGEVTP